MSSEIPLGIVGFLAAVAFELFFPSVCLHVSLQISMCNEKVVALITFERLLVCVFPHYVNFQCASCNA